MALIDAAPVRWWRPAALVVRLRPAPGRPLLDHRGDSDRGSRFWWFVPIAVPALAATLALFIGIAAGGPLRPPRLAARPGPRRRLGAGRSCPPVHRHRLPLELARQRLGVPGRLGDVFIQPAALISIHGLTVLTVLLALTPVLSWRWRSAGGVLLAAWAAFGVIRLHQKLPRRLA